MTKCLAFRLMKVLPNIIHSDQTGFMRGRYIGNNIRNILEIIETVEEEDLSCIILSVDFKKAFGNSSNNVWTILNLVLPLKNGPVYCFKIYQAVFLTRDGQHNLSLLREVCVKVTLYRLIFLL